MKESNVTGFIVCPYVPDIQMTIEVTDNEGNYQGQLGCDYENDPWSGGPHYRIRFYEYGSAHTHYFNSLIELQNEWNEWCRNIMQGKEIAVPSNNENCEHTEFTIHEGLLDHWTDMFEYAHLPKELKTIYLAYMRKRTAQLGFNSFPSAPVLSAMLVLTDKDEEHFQNALNNSSSSNTKPESFYCMQLIENPCVRTKLYSTMDELRNDWNAWCERVKNSDKTIKARNSSFGDAKYSIGENILDDWKSMFRYRPILWDDYWDDAYRIT